MYCSTLKTFLITLFWYVGRLLMLEMLFGQRIGREKRLFSFLIESCPFALCHVRNVFSWKGFILPESFAFFFLSYMLLKLHFLLCHGKGRMLLMVRYTWLKYLNAFLVFSILLRAQVFTFSSLHRSNTAYKVNLQEPVPLVILRYLNKRILHSVGVISFYCLGFQPH